MIRCKFRIGVHPATLHFANPIENGFAGPNELIEDWRRLAPFGHQRARLMHREATVITHRNIPTGPAKQGTLMAIERTFSIIKPDATARNLTGKINAMIEDAGLRIVAQKRVRWTRAQAEKFYEEHKERPFYGELVDFMTSGPIVCQVLEGENAIAHYRKVMGATNPAEADEGTIRKVHAASLGENSVHGSDAPASAEREIALNFALDEIVG